MSKDTVASAVPADAPASLSGRALGRRLPHRSRADLVALGLAARKRAPRKIHAGFEPPTNRPDPIAILEAQAATRVPELLPIRYGRMMMTPFTFYRGAAAVMAADLASRPHTGLQTQLCGDAHLSNFGAFASPERTLVFDLNDFDETLAGPFEWDVKRLATSFAVAGRAMGWKSSLARRALTSAMGAYRVRMAEYAGMGALQTWYSRIAIGDLAQLLPKDTRAGLDALARQASRRDSLGAFRKLTEEAGGTRRFRSQPPLLVRVGDRAVDEELHQAFAAYRRTLPHDRRQMLDRYRYLDIAHKVVGVGSVGTRCWIVYLEGADAADPLILQVKEATASVLEPWLGKPLSRHHGQRVVMGQKLMQATSDVLLGWVTGPQGYHYYWRQLWDAKLSIDLERVGEPGLVAYARACGWALARAHARSGSAISIAAYIGTSGRFEDGMVDFADSYADQNERDHAALVAAVRTGRIEAVEGV